MAFFVLSISLNVLMFIGGMAYSAASSAFHAMTGIRTVAMQHADEVAELGSELSQERAAKRQARSELTDVTGDLAAERATTRKLRAEMGDVAESLAVERATTRKLRSELREAAPAFVMHRGRKVAIKEAVDTTAERISRRAAATSTREIGSMAGEAIPYLGIAVVVGATALELKDLCDTLKDMDELRRAFDPDATDSDERQTVCAQRVPTREELWEIAKASPGNAWNSARNAIPTLEEVKSYELPDVDWSGYYSRISDGAGGLWGRTIEGASGLVDDTKGLIWSDTE